MVFRAVAADRTHGWWEDYRGRLPSSFLDLSELEHHATYRQDVEFLFIRHRMQRRVVLEAPAPVPYEALIHEAALRIMVGSRTAARAQLARVLELLTQRTSQFG